MEDSTAGFAGVAPGDSPNDFIVRNLDGNHGIDVLNHVQGFGLRDGSGKAVEHHALSRIRLGQTFLNDAHDDVVRHKRARLHVRFGFLPDLGPRGHGGAQHVAG